VDERAVAKDDQSELLHADGAADADGSLRMLRVVERDGGTEGVRAPSGANSNGRAMGVPLFCRQVVARLRRTVISV
jgi:hypothetical protein